MNSHDDCSNFSTTVSPRSNGFKVKEEKTKKSYAKRSGVLATIYTKKFFYVFDIFHKFGDKYGLMNSEKNDKSIPYLKEKSNTTLIGKDNPREAIKLGEIFDKNIDIKSGINFKNNVTKFKYDHSRYKHINNISKKDKNLLSKYFDINIDKVDKVDSNIYLQIAYNYDEVKKIIGMNINNIVYGFRTSIKCNEKEDDGEENSDTDSITSIRACWKWKETGTEDLFGNSDEENVNIICNHIDTDDCKKKCTNSKKNVAKTIIAISHNSLLYGLGEPSVKKINGKKQKIYKHSTKFWQKLFEYLQIISLARNGIAHNENQLDEVKEIASFENTRSIMKKNMNEEAQKYIRNNSFNIELAGKIYNDNGYGYQDFLLSNKVKNLGISIKKIRDLVEMQGNYKAEIDDEEKFKKFVIMLKFEIFRYFNSNHDQLEKMVNELRTCDSEEREKIYETYTKSLIIKDQEKINKVKEVCKGISFKKNKNKKNSDDQILDKIFFEDKNPSNLVVTMYVMSIFMDIKEYNELTARVVNKLEGLKKLLEYQNIIVEKYNDSFDYHIVEMNNKYNLLAQCKTMKEIEGTIIDLQKINMVRCWRKAKYIELGKIGAKYVYKDASKLFRNLNTNNFDKNKTLKSKKDKVSVTNFLANNVAKSKFFRYLIQYTNNKDISDILYHNRPLCLFLLRQLSPSQITGKTIEKYADELSNLTFENIKGKIVYKDAGEPGEAVFSRNTIKVYLTCLYLLIKNMVKINSFYSNAWSEFAVLNPKNEKSKNDFYLTIAEKYQNDRFVESNKEASRNANNPKYKIKFKEPDYKHRIKNNKVFKNYRNFVQHVEIVGATGMFFKNNKNFDFRPRKNSNSNFTYFRLYHYILQCYLLNLLKDHEKEKNLLGSFMENIKRNKNYSKDMLNEMNILFYYNKARYKDLSNEYIFMKKYYDRNSINDDENSLSKK